MQVAKTASHSEVIGDSRFIGYCFPLDNEVQARQCLEDIRCRHPKATHICWAYRILVGQQVLFYSDDAGEPRGSAGPPILHALERRRLVNTWCGVVRYFGGTKLGIGGLIRAYSRVAGKTLDDAGFNPFSPLIAVEIQLGWTYVSQVYNYLKHHAWKYQELQQGEMVVLRVELPNAGLDEFRRVIQAWGGTLIIN